MCRYLEACREKILTQSVSEGVDTLLTYLYRALNRVEDMERLASSTNWCVVVCADYCYCGFTLFKTCKLLCFTFIILMSILCISYLIEEISINFENLDSKVFISRNGAYYSLRKFGKKILFFGMATFNVFQKEYCVNCKIKT